MSLSHIIGLLRFQIRIGSCELKFDGGFCNLQAAADEIVCRFLDMLNGFVGSWLPLRCAAGIAI